MNVDKILLSSVIFALAVRVSSILHEGAHALVGWLNGVPMTISSWTVHANAPTSVAMAMTAAGPLYSLLQGVACLLVLQSIAAQASVARLLLVWLCLHGFSAGFGYLLTPFAAMGDVALICRLLDVGVVVRVLVLLVGAAGILWTSWTCATLLMPFADAGADLAASDARARVLLELALLPWLVATGIALAFAWPFQNAFSILYEVVCGAFTIAAYRFARRAAAPALVWGWPDARLWPWVVITGLVMLVSRLTLGRSS